jgi:hypothetical protein
MLKIKPISLAPGWRILGFLIDKLPKAYGALESVE